MVDYLDANIRLWFQIYVVLYRRVSYASETSAGNVLTMLVSWDLPAVPLFFDTLLCNVTGRVGHAPDSIYRVTCAEPTCYLMRVNHL